MTDEVPGAGDADGATQTALRLTAVVGQVIRLLRRLAPTEIGPGSLAALATLTRSGPMRLGDLAAREGMAPPTLTRMIATLEDAGYVTRRPDERDRRAVQVSVTAAGARVVTDASAARAAVLRTRLDQLPADQLQALLAALTALEALADDSR